MEDGRLEAILRRWLVWNDDQPKLYAGVLASRASAIAGGRRGVDSPAAPPARRPSRLALARQYLPSLLSAAAMTLVLSCLSMALAVASASVIATGASTAIALRACAVHRVRRGDPRHADPAPAVRASITGSPSVVRLPAFVAALIGLGLNYAAYESEIYRGALEAVQRGQLEAARVLGLSDWQTLRHVRAPQAFRFALAPTTNDFVAMLKDSSLVSVLTVMELTKQTQIFATNLGSWVLPGALCAALYLAMSLPLAQVARRLEARWSAPGAS